MPIRLWPQTTQAADPARRGGAARPEKLDHPRFPMPGACKPTLTRPGGRIAMPPRSTARTTDPSRPRCTAWCNNTSGVSSPRPKRPPVPGCRNSSVTSSTPSWSAASWRTPSCCCAAEIAATTSWSPSAANGAALARPVGRGAWLRRWRTWWTMLFLAWPRMGGKLTAVNLPFVGVGLRYIPASDFGMPGWLHWVDCWRTPTAGDQRPKSCNCTAALRALVGDPLLYAALPKYAAHRC